MIRYAFLATSAMLVLGFAAPASLAADETGERDTPNWEIYVGAFLPSVRSEVAINGESVTPPPVDVEEVLGVEDSKTVPWGGVRWNISERHSLEFEFFRLSRDGQRGFDGEEIEIGDYIVESGSILTGTDLKLGRLTYGYRIIDREKSRLKFKGGLHLANISASLQLSGNLCDVGAGQAPPCPVVGSPIDQSEDVTAPLPHIGASYDYQFTDSLALRLQVIGFAIKLDGIDGAITEVDADLVWQPWKNFGLGLGGRYFNVNVDASGDRLNGEFNYEYYGPALYLTATF